MRFSWPLFIFIAIAIFLWKGLHLNSQKLPSVLIGRTFPSFKSSTVEDPRHFVTEKMLSGKVSIVNIFATWCRSCQNEHTVWMKLVNRHQLHIIGLNYNDDLKAAQQWLHHYGNPYQFTIFDPKGKLGMDLGVYGTPETFILDKKGIIRFRHAGPIDEHLWQTQLLPIIEDLKE
jgi:cytochrome c biogenesis protein CcmG/thiol:disulfide interchange protein DsbE